MKITWFVMALIGLFSFSVMSMLIISLTRKGYPVSFVLTGISIILTLLFFFQTFIVLKYKTDFQISILAVILLAGILSAIGNVAVYEAAKIAPNAGLAFAIGTGIQSGIIALFAFIFFKDKLSLNQLIGLILILVAVFMINIGQKK